MAKRFTDNEKWKKSFFKGLSTVHKLFFLYIHDDCNHAGVWEVEMDVAELRIKESLNEAEILEKFDGYVYVFSNGEKWFMPDFVKFQYGNLNPAVNAHKSVISILQNNDLVKIYEQFIKGSLTLMDKDKDKDKGKDKDTVGISFFEIPHKTYPGTKRECQTELTDFKLKHADWKDILVLLLPAIQKQIDWRRNADGAWRPDWMAFARWIKERHWEDVLTSEGSDKDCIDCGAAYADGHKFGTNARTNLKEYKCKECRGKK